MFRFRSQASHILIICTEVIRLHKNIFTVSSYIHKLIAQGEHQQQDFKFEISDSKKIARSLAAFSNTDGGKLLVVPGQQH